MQGRHVELEITGVAHGGVFVARHEGRVVFVSDAIPGETVVAEITDDAKKSFWRAETIEVITPSEHRRPHPWAAASLDRSTADRAGGAEFGHIEVAHQRELKERVLADSFSRMARIDRETTVEALPSGETQDDAAEVTGMGWRTRLRLHVDENGTPGQYAARSHRVIPVDDLPLAVPEARAIAPLGETFAGAEYVDVIVPSTGNPYVVVGGRTRERAPRTGSIVERVGERDFRLDTRGFWQVHRHAAATLTAAVQQAIDPDAFDPSAANLDLYGGVGLLAAAVGDRFGPGVRITTVESDHVATGHAGYNLSDWVGASAVTARVDAYLRGVTKTAGSAERERMTRATVILDPPRSGAGKVVVDGLAAVKVAQVVYVACDPVALARDTAIFAEKGYELTGMRGFDLFPNTHHVEAVATFRRA